MYSIDDLLQTLKDEQADEVRLSVGSPPIFVTNGELHPVEGPTLNSETVEQFLKTLADTRQRRLLRDNQRVTFIYTLRKKTPFLVKAELRGEEVRLAIS